MNKSKLTNSHGCQVHWLNVRDRTSQSALIVVNQCVYHFHPHTHWPTVASPTVPIVQWVPPSPSIQPTVQCIPTLGHCAPPQCPAQCHTAALGLTWPSSDKSEHSSQTVTNERTVWVTMSPWPGAPPPHNVQCAYHHKSWLVSVSWTKQPPHVTTNKIATNIFFIQWADGQKIKICKCHKTSQ